MSPSSKLHYNLIKDEDQSFVTIFVPGLPARAQSSDHPGFAEAATLLARATVADSEGNYDEAAELGQKAYDLLDPEASMSRTFQKLSDRISVKNGRLYLDNDILDSEGPLIDHILKVVEEGGDFKPLAAFYERLLANPLGHSRESLYPWIQGNGNLTITQDGMVVGYKSVFAETDPETGEIRYRPTRKDGGGIVNGEEFKPGEWLWQTPGSVVEMPRSIVLHSPSEACGVGLHVGTFEYARWFCGDVVLEVHFDPRDVVSVPNTENKIRVCRYTVVGPVHEQYAQAILTVSEPEDDSFDDDSFDDGAEYEAVSSDSTSPFEQWAASRSGQAEQQSANVERDSQGRWVAGRPGSRRDSSGRFAA